jgi:NAD+ synthase
MSAAPDRLRIASAQINAAMGDILGNRRLIEQARARAAEARADLVIYPELAIVGYPPEDLVLRLSVQEACEAAIRELAAQTADSGPAMLVGTPWRENGKLYNSVVLLDGGQVVGVRHKHELPNYGVFDEKRVFTPGPLPGPLPFRGVRLGVMICEDMWQPDVAECLAETGAEILLVTNGSPFEVNKWDQRLPLGVARVVETGLPLLYVNRIGGQDELVFDGGGFAINADHSLAARQPDFIEDIAFTEWYRGNDGWICEKGKIAEPLDRLASIYQAMVVGLRDYVNRNKFPGVVLGLSGGIDSALSAAVAVDALGPQRVRCVMLPSKYTSQRSLDDAAACANALGVPYETIPIEPAYQAFDGMLSEAFKGTKPDITEENLQSRIRGVILMALSNKFGHMVLTTGNKSEMSVGYATLYGDMCGGYSVLKDVYKMTVYELSHWRNVNRPLESLGPAGIVIPPSIIERAPSAELRENQTDQDSLPPYEQLDAILEMLVEKEMPVREIVAAGQPEDVVRRVQHLLYIAEYKRRQAPPGVKITPRGFGRDRRYPITNAFRDLPK